MAILAVFGAVFAIYSTFYYEKRPEITIRTDSLSRVFDLYKPVGNLKILYADQDLRSSRKQLWTMNITVTNSSEADIRKVDFDEAVPFGLSFSNAQIVDVPTLSASDQYLQEHLRMKVNGNQIILSPTMLDSQDSFGISLLLLSSDTSTPTVNGLGKIAGLKQFKMESFDTKASNKSWWKMLVEADAFWVQLARPFVYGIGGLIVLTLLVVASISVATPFTRFAENRKKEKRRTEISKFNPHKDFSRETRALSELYISLGSHGLEQAWKAFCMVKRRLELTQQLGMIKDEGLFLSIITTLAPIKKTYWIFEELSKKGLINLADETPNFPDSFEVSLKELASYVGLELKEDKYGVDFSEQLLEEFEARGQDID